MRKIKKLLVANRSEIAIRIFRAATELGITTVAIYSYEDRFGLHRFKSDEAYQIGEKGEPIKSYLSIEKIINIAKENNIDAIHPGYGFLSENVAFAKRCREENIIFIGPSNEILDSLGDKVKARQMAINADIPILDGSNSPLKTLQQAIELGNNLGYPIILKASHGGGGRGMRVVNSVDELEKVFEIAKRESLNAFGSDEVFIEKFITKAKHIEVQLLGDNFGNLVHLYERDCSLQRRHQKVIEIAPSPNLDIKLRQDICQAAIKIGQSVNYNNAGTVEFLLDTDSNKFYFIEVNPRVQVEHTVTEEITSIDIVKSQILIAQGLKLTDKEINIKNQDDVPCIGFALQCRVTTENPINNFMPDYGRITHYRSAVGAGIRLDAGGAFSGAIINPYFDSMLVKITARGRTFIEATSRMNRALQEFRIRGVKTNIWFLQHLINTTTFRTGNTTTRFIDKTPSLFEFKENRNRANKILKYIAEINVNGNKTVTNNISPLRREVVIPNTIEAKYKFTNPTGTRDIFKKLGAKKFSKWITKQKELLITDTTMRDAHQSLLATRMRTNDMLNISEHYSKTASQMFSLEMWGGATFDTSMRFLNESPWDRLTMLREKIPNTLFQMLIRASSTVGYANYPDNVVKAFVKQSAKSGVDIFRIFDALNWTDNMQVAMDAANEYGAICEATICYTGDILDPKKDKHNLAYYANMAKKLTKMGAHILAIKDMAGLCKPDAISELIRVIRLETDLPIHFHTHDTSGISSATVIAASKAGVDIVDLALASMSGGTSQPNMNTIIEAIKFSDRKSSLHSQSLDNLSNYWRLTREQYSTFESETLPATSDLYSHEMPGGQYTNLLAQARALGLSSQWNKICKVYASVNQLFGDIVKVTPSSKAVGDMALFMVANDLSTEDILDETREHSYPESVLDLISGRMGQPYQGFPDKVESIILKNTSKIDGRVGNTLPAIDFDNIKVGLEKIKVEPNMQNVLSQVLYPKIYNDYLNHIKNYGNTSILPTYTFFHGMEINEEIQIPLEKGKNIIIKYLAISNIQAEGQRTLFFELNGQPREITVTDNSIQNNIETTRKADMENITHISSAMPGMVVNININIGDKIKKGDKLLSIETMKMETTLHAEYSGEVKEILVKSGSQVSTGDLLLIIE